MNYRKFEDLPLWKESLIVTKSIYDVTAKGPFAKDFGLRDQIRRAVVSISSNIVEGFEKRNNNEFIRYLKIAKGSVGEVRNQLYISLSVSYISQAEFDSLNSKLELLAASVGGFINYLEDFKKNNPKFVIRNK